MSSPKHEHDTAAGAFRTSLFAYDGDCAFCRYWVERLKSVVGHKIELSPYQNLTRNSGSYEGIQTSEFRESVKLFEPNEGRATEAAEASFRALNYADSRLASTKLASMPLWLYQNLPGFKFISELIYALIAKSRPLLSRSIRNSKFKISKQIFIRAIGFIYLLAFASLITQILALFGSEGIVSFPWKLSWIYKSIDANTWLTSIFGYDSALELFRAQQDNILLGICWLGIAASLLTCLGLASTLSLALLFLLYQPLVSHGGPFMSFQWDILLLEAGFLSIFLSYFKDKGYKLGSKIIHLLLQLLLFKLMLMSGIVKLASGDASWHNLTALSYHYQTQPIPNPIAYYMHQLPGFIHKASCLVMFIIELVFPFFIFLGQTFRLIAAIGFIGLMLVVILTGNYCFFNLLTIALAFLLLDDELLKPGSKSMHPCLAATAMPAPKLSSFAISPILIFAAINLIALNLFLITRPITKAKVPNLLKPSLELTYKNRIVSNYGLFAVMTTKRNEITIQGSADGKTWLDYQFHWKPGDPKHMPAQVAPHQPRLDWQMWFAALSNYRRNPWLNGLMTRLLQGSEDVGKLFKTNPFPEQPPKYIRAVMQRYQFTKPDQITELGYWQRSKPALYYPSVHLK